MATTGGKDALIERIASSLSTHELIYIQRALVKQWFLHPLKATSAMVIGNITEAKIAQKLALFLTNNMDNLGSSYDLDSISEVGICYNEEHKSMYTSADRICYLRNINMDVATFCPVEIKTMTTKKLRTKPIEESGIEWKGNE